MPLSETTTGPARIAALVLSGLLLLGAAIWIGFADNKSWAILLAMVALILARTLYVGTPTGNPNEEPDQEH